jgi:hypothetical protein
MKTAFVVASVWGVLCAGTAFGKEPSSAPAQKEPAKDPKASTIKDEEAVRCIVQRLEEQTGSKGWKIDLKELAGTAREFVASNGKRNEKGTVNVAKDYPNQGALRVYLVPND